MQPTVPPDRALLRAEETIVSGCQLRIARTAALEDRHLAQCLLHQRSLAIAPDTLKLFAQDQIRQSDQP